MQKTLTFITNDGTFIFNVKNINSVYHKKDFNKKCYLFGINFNLKDKNDFVCELPMSACEDYEITVAFDLIKMFLTSEYDGNMDIDLSDNQLKIDNL